MQTKGVVFVTDEHLGKQVAALLEKTGCQVIRGSEPAPPAHTVFPPDTWPRLFGETHVMKGYNSLLEIGGVEVANATQRPASVKLRVRVRGLL